MMLYEILHCAASDIKRVADQDDPNVAELHFIANALGNLADAIGKGKFDVSGRGPVARRTSA